MTLQIEKDKALKAYNEASESEKKLLINLFGAETFAPQSITDQVKTYKDACSELGVTGDINIEIELSQDVKSVKAYAKLIVIAKALNDGWEPDWSNEEQIKHYPEFEYTGSSRLPFSTCGLCWNATIIGSRLVYKTEALAEYAGRQFESIYNDFMEM